MYYVYGLSGPSLLIESTDSMIHDLLASGATYLHADDIIDDVHIHHCVHVI